MALAAVPTSLRTGSGQHACDILVPPHSLAICSQHSRSASVSISSGIKQASCGTTAHSIVTLKASIRDGHDMRRVYTMCSILKNFCGGISQNVARPWVEMSEIILHNGVLSSPSSSMKSLCTVLIAVLVLHLQCGGSCLAESFGSAAHPLPAGEEPPCHQNAEFPSDSPKPSHQANNPCGQGPIIQSKLTISGKIALQFAAVLPVMVPVITVNHPIVHQSVPADPSAVLSPPIPFSILRI